jgi:hypothetical protein
MLLGWFWVAAAAARGLRVHVLAKLCMFQHKLISKQRLAKCCTLQSWGMLMSSARLQSQLCICGGMADGLVCWQQDLCYSE